ncbi:unnamed protein product, partial [Urochloa humidicola]
ARRPPRRIRLARRRPLPQTLSRRRPHRRPSSNSRPPSVAASGWPAAAVASSSPPPPCPQLFSSSLRTTGARSPRYGCASVWASGPGREEEDDVRERGGLSEAHLPRRSRSISARLTSSSASAASMAGRDDSSWYGRVSSSSASTVAWKFHVNKLKSWTTRDCRTDFMRNGIMDYWQNLPWSMSNFGPLTRS